MVVLLTMEKKMKMLETTDLQQIDKENVDYPHDKLVFSSYIAQRHMPFPKDVFRRMNTDISNNNAPIPRLFILSGRTQL